MLLGEEYEDHVAESGGSIHIMMVELLQDQVCALLEASSHLSCISPLRKYNNYDHNINLDTHMQAPSTCYLRNTSSRPRAHSSLYLGVSPLLKPPLFPLSLQTLKFLPDLSRRPPPFHHLREKESSIQRLFGSRTASKQTNNCGAFNKRCNWKRSRAFNSL